MKNLFASLIILLVGLSAGYFLYSPESNENNEVTPISEPLVVDSLEDLEDKPEEGKQEFVDNYNQAVDDAEAANRELEKRKKYPEDYVCDISGVEDGFVVDLEGEITDIPISACGENGQIGTTTEVIFYGNRFEEKDEEFIFYQSSSSVYLLTLSKIDRGVSLNALYDIYELPGDIDIDNLDLIGTNGSPFISYFHDGKYLLVVSRYAWMGYFDHIVRSFEGVDKQSFQVLGDSLIRDDNNLFYLTAHSFKKIEDFNPNEITIYGSHIPTGESIPFSVYRDNKRIYDGTEIVYEIQDSDSFYDIGYTNEWKCHLNIYFEDSGAYYRYPVCRMFKESPSGMIDEQRPSSYWVEEIEKGSIPPIGAPGFYEI